MFWVYELSYYNAFFSYYVIYRLMRYERDHWISLQSAKHCCQGVKF